MDVAEHDRSPLFGLDLARGIAIFGMVVVDFHIAIAYGERDPPWLLDWTEMLEGRAAALFVMLAGYGVALLGCRRVLVRRALLLLIFGYAWQLVWTGDILHYFGVYLLVGAAVVGAPRWFLGALACVAVTVFVMLFQLLDYGAGWNFTTLEYPEFWSARGQVRNLFFNGWYPVFPWLAFFLCGMVLGRSALHANVWVTRVVGVAAAGVAALVGLLSARWATAPADHVFAWWRNAEFVWGVEPIPPMPLYVFAATGTAVACLCLCLELARLRLVRVVFHPLAAAGRVSLTLYVLHVLVGITLFDALGLSDRGRLVDAWLRALVFSTLVLVIAPFWLRHVGRGPFEWALRRFSR